MNIPHQPAHDRSPDESSTQLETVGWRQKVIRSIIIAAVSVPSLYYKDAIHTGISAIQRKIGNQIGSGEESAESIIINDVPVGDTTCDATVVFVPTENGGTTPHISLRFDDFPRYPNGFEKTVDVKFAWCVRYERKQSGVEAPTYFPSVSIINTLRNDDATPEDIEQLEQILGQLPQASTDTLNLVGHTSQEVEAVMRDEEQRQKFCEHITALALSKE